LLIVFSLFTAGTVKAQSAYQQITLGGGIGAATAYAGASLPQTEAAFYADAGFYPFTDGYINLQAQSGMLAGNAVPGAKNFKSFVNNYKSVTLSGQLFLGVFYSEGNNGFLNFIRKFYGGIGFGVVAGNITNSSFTDRDVKENLTNTLDIIPVTGGYEFNILKNRNNEPVLKINISSTFYYVPAKGLDGYSDVNAAPYSYYTYYAIGLKYIFILHTRPHRDYNRLD
jgi:hypothetical protein